MSSGVDLPVVKHARAAVVTTRPMPGTFLGFGLNLRSDKLYDLGGALPDVMGLRATQPRAPNRFHEILIHDMEDEESR